jgi:hypothetical protein
VTCASSIRWEATGYAGFTSSRQSVTFIFHTAGAALFGVAGSPLAAAAGGLLAPLIMPGLAALHYMRASRPTPSRWSMFRARARHDSDFGGRVRTRVRMRTARRSAEI